MDIVVENFIQVTQILGWCQCTDYIHWPLIGIEVILIDKDTNLLVLLIALAHSNTCLKMLMPETKLLHVRFIVYELFKMVFAKWKNIILSIHTFTLCDAVSLFYRKGKVATL